MTEEQVAPAVDLPISEAYNELTGFETIGILNHYQARDLGEIGAQRLQMGIVWAFANRKERTTWSTVERMTIRELDGYFAPEDPAGPMSDQGKESSG
jgi:hypothetical protein